MRDLLVPTFSLAVMLALCWGISALAGVDQALVVALAALVTSNHNTYCRYREDRLEADDA